MLRFMIGAVFVILSTAVPISAQVPSFQPVTDAMLEDPPPESWLNWRRTRDGWGYSPLTQINTDNVHELQLVWAWQLNTGVSRPTPLVYDGLMFIPNPGNSVQALDATTGELVWQFTREPEDRTDSLNKILKKSSKLLKSGTLMIKPKLKTIREND